MDDLIPTRLSNNNMVDREDETSFIMNVIKNKIADLLIIYSESGIGKSTLTNRVLKRISGGIPICVRTMPENMSGSHTEGNYLTRVFNCFVSFFSINKGDYSKCTFDYYISHNKNTAIKKEALEEMLSQISAENLAFSSGLAVGKYIISKISRIYEYNSANRLTLSTKDSMLIAHEYIKYVLKNQKVYVCIDNLQNIDYYSLQLLTEWLTVAAGNSFFLLEYTINKEKGVEPLLEFTKIFQNLDLDVQLLPLKGLDLENALEALKKVHPDLTGNQRFFDEFKIYFLHHSNGNMQKLLDFTFQYNAESILKKTYDPTYEKIYMLSSNSKYILSVIIMHGGEVEKNLLRHIILQSLIPLVLDYEKQIQDLLYKYELLTEENNIYIIRHASITDAWRNHSHELKKYDLLSYKNCSAYYGKIADGKTFGSKENIEQALLFLLRVHSQYGPEQIIEIVGKMKYMVSERIRPENIFEYYLIFLDYIKGKEAEYVESLYEMMLFCFHHGLFKNCLFLIQKLEDIPLEEKNIIIFIYKVNSIEYLELHEDAIRLCEERLRENSDEHEIYICYLLLMGCHRSLNNMGQVLDYVKKIKEIPQYTKYDEYGIFLRLSEIYMERSEAIPFVKKSVLYYKGKSSILEGKSRITYSFLLAVTNDLETAKLELERAEALDRMTHYWDSIICLNKASILLLQKKFGEEVSALLKKAELSTNSSFDLLLILTLQLLNCLESGENDNDSYLLNRISRLLSHESDKHLVALVSYNLYLYFSKTGYPDKANEYLAIAEKTQNYNSTVSCHLHHKTNPNTPNLFVIDWCIGFTFFWNVDYEAYR